MISSKNLYNYPSKKDQAFQELFISYNYPLNIQKLQQDCVKEFNSSQINISIERHSGSMNSIIFEDIAIVNFYLFLKN